MNEAVVIKQSLSSLLSMFIPMAALAVSAGAYAIGGIWAALAVVVLLCAVPVVILWRGGGKMLHSIA